MFNYVKKLLILNVMCSSIVAASGGMVTLTPPDLSPENFIGYNIGHRPCRSKGLRLEHEWVRASNGKEKLLVHNYGHGGAGVSLSWGCADMVEHIIFDNVLSVPGLDTKSVAVVGAGVIGMTVAHILLERGYNVCVYAQATTPDTMSNVAVGVFSPDLGVSMDDAIMLESIKQFAKQAMGEIVNKHTFKGARLAPGYYFSDADIEAANPEDCKMVDFGFGVEPRLAAFRGVITVDIPFYLQDLYEKMLERGARVERCVFDNKEAIFDLPEDIIVNCSGMASKKLFHDDSLYAVRGEILYFKAQPGVDYRLHYAVPGSDVFTSLSTWDDRIIIGGSLERVVDHYEVDEDMCNGLYGNIQNLIKPGCAPDYLSTDQLVPADYCNVILRDK